MINDFIKYGIVFIVVVLLQVLLFNNIHLGGLVTPFFYVLFLLLLPFDTPRYLLLILGFILGLSVDVFSNTTGLHASAGVFLAFIRPGALMLLSTREMYEKGPAPRLGTFGFPWFLRYTLILVVAHHLFLYGIEAFSLSFIMNTILKAVLSSLLTTFLIVLSQFLVFRE